ncbi:hypothetical protein BCR43DRAFT_511528 [Syncephalastrum racemosum]|uniref:ATPase inhibitor, mitochondrial n=1 Tax=Syncephalastrum racemosum TaxID=13706 RepID=A0A1X2HMA3_SYNRA|nr:hypothetical protein BCR43DRAFT_511528 [Syncephalastrum racemosum]
MYSSAGKEGDISAARGGFGDKEKAVENQWARQHDADKIKQLQERLAEQEKANKTLAEDVAQLKQQIKKD